MKIRIEIEPDLEEEEVVIRCPALTEKIQTIQQSLLNTASRGSKLDLYKKDTLYYISLDDILFFETEDGTIHVHTRKEIFETKYKLYELEEILPGRFMRISKSAICNTSQIYAIKRNLTASSIVEFVDSHKQIYVSRNYYKALLDKMQEKRK